MGKPINLLLMRGRKNKQWPMTTEYLQWDSKSPLSCFLIFVLGGRDLRSIYAAELPTCQAAVKPRSVAPSLFLSCSSHLLLISPESAICSRMPVLSFVSKESDLRQGSSFVSLKHLVTPITHSPLLLPGDMAS